MNGVWPRSKPGKRLSPQKGPSSKSANDKSEKRKNGRPGLKQSEKSRSASAENWNERNETGAEARAWGDSQMETEDKIYGLIAHAEDAQNALRSFQATAQEAVKTLPEAARGAVRDAAREFIVQGAETASRGLLDASSEAKAAASSLRRTGLLQGVFLLAVALVVIGAAYAASVLLVKSRVDELAELKAAIRAEEATLAELRSKTWGLELVNYGDGTRGILLPKGIKIDRTGAVQDGRAAVVIKP